MEWFLLCILFCHCIVAVPVQEHNQDVPRGDESDVIFSSEIRSNAQPLGKPLEIAFNSLINHYVPPSQFPDPDLKSIL